MDTEDIILEELRALRGETKDIGEELVRNEERRTNIETKLDQVHAAIYGNGRPGIYEEIDAINEVIDDVDGRVFGIEKTRKKISDDRAERRAAWLNGWRGVFFGAVGTAATIGVTYLLSLIF